MPLAWDIHTGSPSQWIAIVDSGIDQTHYDIAGMPGKLYRGWNFVDNNQDTMDYYGHGTAVAGIAAAITDNTYIIAGTAPLSTLLAVKITNDRDIDSYKLAQGIEFASNYAEVINASSYVYIPSTYLQEAVEYAYNVKNRVVVACTGNDGASIPSYAAAYSACIGVGATDRAVVL